MSKQIHIPCISVRLNCVSELSFKSAKQDLLAVLAENLASFDKEMSWVVCLDDSFRMKCIACVGIGDSFTSSLCIADIIRVILLSNCNNFLFVHNHLSARLDVSEEDIQTSQKLYDIGRLLGLTLVDSIVISKNKQYCSVMPFVDRDRNMFSNVSTVPVNQVDGFLLTRDMIDKIKIQLEKTKEE